MVSLDYEQYSEWLFARRERIFRRPLSGEDVIDDGDDF
jgi:hypothetical protein